MSLLLLNLRVLVVDDNRDAADSLGELLRAFGAEVRVCYDATTALSGPFAPEAGVLDVDMPVMDGCELARRLRAVSPARILLVALTGVGDEDARRRTAEAGFDLHLTKGTDTDAVVAPLAAFGRWRREQEVRGGRGTPPHSAPADSPSKNPRSESAAGRPEVRRSGQGPGG